MASVKGSDLARITRQSYCQTPSLSVLDDVGPTETDAKCITTYEDSSAKVLLESPGFAATTYSKRIP